MEDKGRFLGFGIATCNSHGIMEGDIVRLYKGKSDDRGYFVLCGYRVSISCFTPFVWMDKDSIDRVSLRKGFWLNLNAGLDAE